MIISLPPDLLPQTALLYVLAFARIGSAMMVLPGLGELSISGRVRLVMALAVTVALTPVVASAYPSLPLGIGPMAGSLIAEIFTGVFIGLIARIFMSALQVAGTVIAFQSGLAFAMNVDPSQGTQGAIIGNYLVVLGTAMIFATNTHHLMLTALHDSYVLFPPGASFPTTDFLAVAIESMSKAFGLGMQLATPFIVFSLIFYLGIGIISKLIPQVQIFFVAMPANILVGFILLLLMLSALMLWFFDHFQTMLRQFIL